MSEHVVLVFGGRNYRNKWHVYTVLDSLQPSPTCIVEGGAQGADKFARSWAIDRDVPYITVEANWLKFGKAAGPIRNQQMIDEEKPDLGVGFPGGKGTADMLRRLKAANIPVLEIP